MFFHLNSFSKKRYVLELKHIILLALPMLIAQLAQVGMGFVDTVMAGAISASDLAAVGLGSSIFITFYVTLLGIPTALNPILSHLFGEKNHEQLAESCRQGMWLSFFLGLGAMVLMWLLMIPLQAALTLDKHTVDTAVLYIIGISFGMPAAIFHRALQAYAAALNRTNPVMWASIFGLLLNIPLNYILIHGLYGMPRLGGAGCGFASATVYWFNALFLWFYISKSHYFKTFGLMKRFSWPQWSAFYNIIKLGLPISLSFFLEVSLFSFITLLIANLGEEFIAAQQVVIVISSIIYMLPQTLGAATSVCVGQALGQGERLRARYISGVGLSSAIMGAVLTGLFIISMRYHLVRLFTDNAAVLAVTVNLLIFAAVFQVADATQTVASGALRGYKLTKIPMIIHGIAFWVMGLGLGYLLAFHFNWGLYGFWMSLVVALFCAAIALSLYLSRVSEQFLKRKSIWM